MFLDCNGTFKADSGTILSPRYPRDYYSNADCYWIITTNVGTTVNVKFQDFELEGSDAGVGRSVRRSKATEAYICNFSSALIERIFKAAKLGYLPGSTLSCCFEH